MFILYCSSTHMTDTCHIRLRAGKLKPDLEIPSLQFADGDGIPDPPPRSVCQIFLKKIRAGEFQKKSQIWKSPSFFHNSFTRCLKAISLKVLRMISLFDPTAL